MTEISKLKKENKQLRALLRDAVDLLKQSKKLLKRPKNKAEGKKPKKETKKKETRKKETKKKETKKKEAKKTS